MPTILLSRVDFPALGLPARVVMPALVTLYLAWLVDGMAAIQEAGGMVKL
jgi:hypothetical protein